MFSCYIPGAAATAIMLRLFKCGVSSIKGSHFATDNGALNGVKSLNYIVVIDKLKAILYGLFLSYVNHPGSLCLNYLLEFQPIKLITQRYGFICYATTKQKYASIIMRFKFDESKKFQSMLDHRIYLVTLLIVGEKKIRMKK